MSNKNDFTLLVNKLKIVKNLYLNQDYDEFPYRTQYCHTFAHEEEDDTDLHFFYVKENNVGISFSVDVDCRTNIIKSINIDSCDIHYNGLIFDCIDITDEDSRNIILSKLD